MKCTKVRCPLQHNIDDECNIIGDCPYRTEPIDFQKVIESYCEYIADLVVKKLEEKQKDDCQ